MDTERSDYEEVQSEHMEDTSFTQQSYSSENRQAENPYEAPKKKKMSKGAKAALIAVPCVAVGGILCVTVAGGLFLVNSLLKSQKITTDKTDATLNYSESTTDSQIADNSSSTTSDATLASQDGTTATITTTTTGSGDYSDLSDMVADVLPSVVNVNITMDISYNQFGQTYSGEYGTASGSGVIISQDDNYVYIVTNNHVVSAEDTSSSSYYYFSATTSVSSITVTFDDDSTYDAVLRGTDEEHDLAVIAVSIDDMSDSTLDNIKIATIGNSDEVRLGQTAIAIGNALGYGKSVTQGIISALGREVTFSDGYTRTLMQTDAAINPGNSGGGLFNENGELIGINSAKYSDTDVEGVGYAIPISDVTDMIIDLINYVPREELDSADQGFLGVGGQDITNELSSYYGMPTGVYVTSVVEDSAAEAAGIQTKDIITKVNGQTVSTREELTSTIKTYAVGETVTITIQRLENGEYREMTVDATLTSRADYEASLTQDSEGASSHSDGSHNSQNSEGNSGYSFDLDDLFPGMK